MTTPAIPPFLRLPLELRYAIYDQFCIPKLHSYPYKQPSPIAAIDIVGPPMSLLLLNHALLEEILNYYFAHCTFRFVAQSFSNAKNIRNMPAGSLQIIHRLRKVELLLLPGTMKATPYSTRVPMNTRGMSEFWLANHISLLRDEANELKTVIVSMRRVSWNHEWSMREETQALLIPLEDLKGRVCFRVGEVVGPAAVEKEMLEELTLLLEGLNS